MQKKIKGLSLLLIGSWALIFILAVFIIILEAENLWLKQIIKNSEHSFAATNALLDYKSSQERTLDQRTQEYLDWQSLLKEQAKDAGRRLSSSLKLVSRGKTKNELANSLYFNLALNNMMVSDFNGAGRYFEEALKYDSRDAQSYYNLALLYSFYFKNSGKAIDFYNRYLRLIPEGSEKELVKERIKELQQLKLKNR